MAPKERFRLRVLFEERKNLAKKVDKPVFMILSNKQLLAFSKNPPYTVDSWKKLKSVHPLVRKKAVYLHQLIKNAGEEEYVKKKKPRLPIDQYEKIKKLTEERNILGDKLKIAGYLILSNDQIREIVVNHNLDCLRNWQRELIVNEGIVKGSLSE